MPKNKDGAMRREFTRTQALIEDNLCSFFTDEVPQKTLLEAMRYSLLAGGKRIRPVITLQFCAACGGDMADAMAAVCAIEMMHTYSLIHDDLPCMDDDALRRGEPTNHIVFGEYTAVLAGDALQAAAFDTLLKSNLPGDAVVRMARVLADASGAFGICGGQQLDMQNEGKTLTREELIDIHSMKTASMLSAAAQLGVMAAGGTTEQQTAAAEYALALGLAFQVRDDILDSTMTTAQLGKPAGSDKESGKFTFVSLLGAAECNKIVRAETKKAILALRGKFENPGFLIWLAEMLEERKY